MTIKEFLIKEIAWRKKFVEDPDPNIEILELAHEEIILRAYERALAVEETSDV